MHTSSAVDDPLQACLPQWQFAETHHTDTTASPEALLRAAQAYDPVDDPLIGAALALREAPGRLAARLGWRSALAQRPRFGLADFTPLGQPTAHSLAYGLVGRFWEPGYGLVPQADAAAFAACRAPGAARLLLGFVAQPLAAAVGGQPRTRLLTTTRVFCPDAATRRRLAPYWWLIRPVSGLIRQRMLGQIARTAERAGQAGGPPPFSAPG